MVLHKPQLDALKALIQGTDDFDELSLHIHDNDEDNNLDVGNDEARAVTTNFSNAFPLVERLRTRRQHPQHQACFACH
eukprot:351125-Pleurochrysis_carterae.AAC.1